MNLNNNLKQHITNKPLPCNPAAETALRLPSWCSGSSSFQVSASLEECVVHRRNKDQLRFCLAVRLIRPFKVRFSRKANISRMISSLL